MREGLLVFFPLNCGEPVPLHKPLLEESQGPFDLEYLPLEF
jgi:hypothetical protein